jgi:hypothetical protein
MAKKDQLLNLSQNNFFLKYEERGLSFSLRQISEIESQGKKF